MKTVKYLAFAIIGLLLALIFVNLGDEKLKPEVKAALNWQAPANAFEDNGYLTLLGLEAPAEQDAGLIGKQILQAELARFAKFQTTHQEQPSPPKVVDDYINWKDNRCDYANQANCVDFYLSQGAAKNTFLLASQQRLIDRFRVIKNSKNYVEVFPPSATAMIPSYQPLINASELARIDAVLEITNNNLEVGTQKLIENAKFSRRLLRESNTLISHMIAVNMMQRDTRILSELLAKYPKLASQHHTNLAPMLAGIAAQEFSLKKSLIYERDMTIQMMNSLAYATTDQLTGSDDKLKNMLASIGFQASATTNLFYDMGTENLKFAEAPAHALDGIKPKIQAQYQSLLGFGFRPYYFKNPVGKILAQVGSPNFVDYAERQHDLDGYLSLVRLQLARLAEPKKVTELLPKYLNPYTQMPFEFDTKADVVKFVARKSSANHYQKSQQYQISLQ